MLLRLTLRSLRTGAAALGLALVLLSDDMAGKAALLVVGALAAVGALSRMAHRWSLVASALVSGILVGLAGTHASARAAAILTALLTLAVCLRLGLREVVSGLAVFGAGVVLLAGAASRLLLAFWLFGWAGEALAELRARCRRTGCQD